ncbi:MAG: CARDB domain-containing protein [Crocinitomicaceae bacterium]
MLRYLLPLLILNFFNCFSQGIQPPYFNPFDDTTSDTLWYHYAITGSDDWQMGPPYSSGSLSDVQSYPGCWVTKANGSMSANSVMALETPYFDFTNIDTNYALSFFHSKHFYNQTSFILEYTTDSINWNLYYDPAVRMYNWQDQILGFQGNTVLQRSSVKLNSLVGLDSVKFRFKLSTPPTSTSYRGWLIDDFRIGLERFDLYGIAEDTLSGYNKFIPDFEVNHKFGFWNEWAGIHSFKLEVYFSTDPNLDALDLFLDDINLNTGGSVSFLNRTYSMPANLAAGTYYILTNIDVLDSLDESNESNNVSITVLEIDSILPYPYIEDFDSSVQMWSNFHLGYGFWTRGESKMWDIEKPRSGENSWYSYSWDPPTNAIIQSPYIDMSSAINPTLCYWFSSIDVLSGIAVPERAFLNGIPVFSQSISSASLTRMSRRYGWDCHCISMPTMAGNNYDKIALLESHLGTYSYPSNGQIDDLYLGEPKPDVSIEFDKLHRFTRSDWNTDTLHYSLFNSGLSPLPQSKTNFYWSTDSIFDPSDIILGTQNEAIISDTSFIDTFFVFSKQSTLVSSFFIIAINDADSVIDEMREYDNMNYVKIIQETKLNLPYFNDFEIHNNNWRASSSIGTNMYQYGAPLGNSLDTLFAQSKSLTASAGLEPEKLARTHIFSPIYDLTQLSNPILEFDFSNEVYPNSSQLLTSIMYSIDGGQKWESIETSNDNNSPLYLEYIPEYGVDELQKYVFASLNSRVCYADQNNVLKGSSMYQGRNYDNNHHFSIDLHQIKHKESVKFMFVIAKKDSSVHRILIDNFQIREAESDLIGVDNKSLMLSSIDKVFNENILIKNNNNSVSDSTGVNIYMSFDSQLNVGQDLLISTKKIRRLRPYEKDLIHIRDTILYNLLDYNYLILDIDPDNLIPESNELNNQHVIRLNMDTVQHLNNGYFNDFEADEIDGWKWYSDSIGQFVFNNLPIHYTLRHKPLISDPNWAAYSPTVLDREWVLDWTNDLTIGGISYYYFPTFYLESPSISFSNLTNIELSFDILSEPEGTNEGGSNLEYSIDGGQSWDILGIVNDPLATNWYIDDIEALNFEPGWNYSVGFPMASYSIQNLSGIPNIKFRFKIRMETGIGNYINNGFRMDNFQISGTFIDTLAPIEICQLDSALIFGLYRNQTGFYLDSFQNIAGNDSIIVQELIVLPLAHSNSINSICYGESFTFTDGTTIPFVTTDSTRTTIIANGALNGCDSIIETIVNVVLIDTTISEVGNQLIIDQTPGIYQWLYCSDYAPVSGEYYQQFTPPDGSAYAAQIEYAGCIDTTECVNHSTATIEDLQGHGFNLFPNPTTGEINLSIQSSISNVELQIVNQLGQIILTKENISSGEHQLFIEGEKGVYKLFIREKGKIIFESTIVKQ